MKIVVVAGELSGDLYAGHVVRHLKTLAPDSEIWAVGGPQLKQYADHFVAETVFSSAVGIKGMLTAWVQPTWMSVLKQVVDRQEFDRAIIVDFPHHNDAIAALFTSYKIKIDTFITPNFWIWKDLKKSQKIIDYSDRIFTIFEPEYQLYKSRHPRVHFWGHPMDELCPIRDHFIPPPSPCVTFFPGSRHQEIELMMPPMMAIARRVQQRRPEVRLTMQLSSPVFESRIREWWTRYPEVKISFWEGNKEDLLRQTSVLVSASGSATLEGILYKVPMVMLAALPPVTYAIAKWVIRLNLPVVTLPNLIAGRMAVREWVQFFNPSQMSEEVLELLDANAAVQWVSVYPEIERSLRHCERPLFQTAQQILMR